MSIKLLRQTMVPVFVTHTETTGPVNDDRRHLGKRCADTSHKTRLDSGVPGPDLCTAVPEESSVPLYPVFLPTEAS